MKNNHKIIIEMVDAIPYEGWWTDDGRDKFIDIAKSLIEKGLSIDEIGDILGSAYSAVASEFGN